MATKDEMKKRKIKSNHKINESKVHDAKGHSAPQSGMSIRELMDPYWSWRLMARAGR